jgi:hypothetical protein
MDLPCCGRTRRAECAGPSAAWPARPGASCRISALSGRVDDSRRRALDALMRFYREANDALMQGYQAQQDAHIDGLADPPMPRSEPSSDAAQRSARLRAPGDPAARPVSNIAAVERIGGRGAAVFDHRDAVVIDVFGVYDQLPQAIAVDVADGQDDEPVGPAERFQPHVPGGVLAIGDIDPCRAGGYTSAVLPAAAGSLCAATFSGAPSPSRSRDRACSRSFLGGDTSWRPTSALAGHTASVSGRKARRGIAELEPCARGLREVRCRPVAGSDLGHAARPERCIFAGLHREVTCLLSV